MIVDLLEDDVGLLLEWLGIDIGIFPAVDGGFEIFRLGIVGEGVDGSVVGQGYG